MRQPQSIPQIACKREKRDVSGPFDFNGKRTLVLSAVAADSPGHDFTSLGKKLVEYHGLFISQIQVGVRAELADLFSASSFKGVHIYNLQYE